MAYGTDQTDEGFTLVEILIAIVLVGILSAVVVIGVGSLTSKGSTAACQASADAARAGANAAWAINGTQPTSFTDLTAASALTVPSGASVTANAMAVGGATGWSLLLVPGTAGGPPSFVCAPGSTTAYGALDQVGATPLAAFSLRRLRGAYPGAAIQVRRSSDNAAQDIGFTPAGALDTAALTAFVGAGNSGFVTVWYDQSGNGRDVRQTTAANQPLIVASGTVFTMNARPAIQFGVGRTLAAGSGMNGLNDGSYSVSFVSQLIDTSGGLVEFVNARQGLSAGWIVRHEGTSTNHLRWLHAGMLTGYVGLGPSLVNAPLQVTQSSDGTQVVLRANAGAVAGGGPSGYAPTTSNGLMVGYSTGDSAGSELVAFDAPLGTADRAVLEQSQMSSAGL